MSSYRSCRTGRVAVDTSLTRGIGLAIARVFAEKNDAEVVICSGRSKQRAVQPAKEISSKAFGAKLDITDISGVVQLLEEIMGTWNNEDI